MIRAAAARVDSADPAASVDAATGAIPVPAAGPARRRTILLATDLSPASEPAEGEAIALARDLRTSLLILSVIDPKSLRTGFGQWVQRMDQARASLEERSRDLVGRARAAGVPVRLLIWEGDPAESIVDAAIAESVDYIVVGSHGRHGVDRVLLGSISDQVIRTASVPVIVARSREAAV
jgi:nucleotide-binding universal stress UspA family protein